MPWVKNLDKAQLDSYSALNSIFHEIRIRGRLELEYQIGITHKCGTLAGWAGRPGPLSTSVHGQLGLLYMATGFQEWVFQVVNQKLWPLKAQLQKVYNITYHSLLTKTSPGAIPGSEEGKWTLPLDGGMERLLCKRAHGVGAITVTIF